MAGTKLNKTRFDARLSVEQKQFFEKAAVIGGFRSLSDFVISSAQEKAREIINDNEQILASEKDQKVFFDAVLNPPAPNKNLQSAFEAYRQSLNE